MTDPDKSDPFMPKAPKPGLDVFHCATPGDAFRRSSGGLAGAIGGLLLVAGSWAGSLRGRAKQEQRQSRPCFTDSIISPIRRNDVRQNRIGADLAGRDDEASVPVDHGPGHCIARESRGRN